MSSYWVIFGICGFVVYVTGCLWGCRKTGHAEAVRLRGSLDTYTTVLGLLAAAMIVGLGLFAAEFNDFTPACQKAHSSSLGALEFAGWTFVSLFFAAWGLIAACVYAPLESKDVSGERWWVRCNFLTNPTCHIRVVQMTTTYLFVTFPMIVFQIISVGEMTC